MPDWALRYRARQSHGRLDATLTPVQQKMPGWTLRYRAGQQKTAGWALRYRRFVSFAPIGRYAIGAYFIVFSSGLFPLLCSLVEEGLLRTSEDDFCLSRIV